MRTAAATVFPREINEAAVLQLHRSTFIECADNVVLIGDLDTGKSHVATALGIRTVRYHHKKVRFTHHCHILEIGNDSFRFQASAAAPKIRKEKIAT